ncbi:MAG: hypothetical protein JNM65_06605 [Verrucomicrobiaceae bacterium]|nr:hypothetical protein [Verrucomicrobiaceae bacterium]
MVTFARFLMRSGMLVMLVAALTWIASKFGWFVETARWTPHAAGGGLLLLIIGSNIFFRRTSGVRDLPPGRPHERNPGHFR